MLSRRCKGKVPLLCLQRKSDNSLKEQLSTFAMSELFDESLEFELHKTSKQTFSGKLQATPHSKAKTKVRDSRFSRRIFYGRGPENGNKSERPVVKQFHIILAAFFYLPIPMKEAPLL